MALFDIKSASVSGVYNLARARVLWKGGLLRLFTPDGLVLQIRTTTPQRRKGFLSSWSVALFPLGESAGEVVLRSKCITCGGPKWWRVTMESANDLWNSEP